MKGNSNALAELLGEAARALDQPKLQDVLARRRQALAAMSRELTNPRLRIGVIGVTSSGKSTFLNALMGERLLPEQSKPTSNVLVHVRNGPERRITISYLDGRAPAVRAGTAVTAGVLLQLTAEDHNPGNRLQIARIEVELPSLLLDPRFEIVDTPGLDAYGFDWHQTVTLDEFVPQADVIIYMTSIRNPFKDADFKALETVLEHDQRVLFLMSGKDMEVDDFEGHQVANSREAKLRGHLARLQRDAAAHRGLKTAGHVLIDSAVALRSRGKAPGQWAWSGFPEVVSVLQGFSTDLLGLMAESRVKRAALHLDESVAQLKLLIAGAAGKQGDPDAAHLRAAQAEKVKKLMDAIAEARRAIEKVDCASNLDDVLAPMRKAQLGEKDAETAFKDVGDACDAKLAQAHDAIRAVVKSARDHLTKIVGKCGLNAPRDPITDETMDQLPAITLASRQKDEEYTRSRGWFEGGWKFWPGKETGTRKVSVIDVAAFKSTMESRGRGGLARLAAHVKRVRQTLTDRYVSVLARELANLEQGLAAAEQALSTMRTEERMLTETLTRLEQIQQRLGAQEAAAAAQPLASQPATMSAPSPADRGDSGASASRALLPFLAGYRELRLHRRFLQMFAHTAPQRAEAGEPYRVAVLGLDLQDRTHLVNLLLHRLKEPLVLQPEPGHPVMLTDQQEPFLRKAHLLVAADDAAPGWNASRAGEIAAWADICLVMLDGPRIGSGLSDLDKAPYRQALERHPHKVVYLIPHGAKFHHQLPSLAAEVVPLLLAQGPYGERPVIVYENYDDRYCDYLQLIGVTRTPAEFRRRWHVERLASLPPFEPDKLEFLYEAGRHNS